MVCWDNYGRMNDNLDTGERLPHSAPIVVVIVEGGIDTFDYVYKCIQCRIPLVMCEGSGRAADILAYAYAHCENEEVEGAFVGN
jgi:hypothetical protein